MKSLSKTPAPAKDRIYGSKVNPKGSASSEKSAKDIQLSAKTIIALNNKLKEFKETHNTKKVSISDLKAVYRRGLGAYSTSHRPNIPRNAWAMARVNAFLRKAGGGEHKKAYVQDDDLLKYAEGGKVKFNDKELLAKYKNGESIGFTGVAHLKSEGLIKRVDGTKRKSMADGGEVGQEIKCRRCGWEWNTNQSDEADKYICKCGFDNRTFYDADPIGYKDGGEVEDKKKTYEKWKSLVNMSYSEIEKFYNSKEGKEAGLSSSEANAQGISSGRESARMIMKMKKTPVKEWTDTMWKWANKQISFISRMSGMKGDLYDDKGNKTRKHTSLLIWGHNPKKYNNGGETSTKFNDPIIYHEKNGNFFVAKNTIYFWLYDNKDAGQKLNDGEFDFVMFPPATMGMAMQKGFVPPLQLIWTKKYQNKTKGSEHLIGIIQALYDEDNKKMYIEMMTTNPKLRGKGIMSYMIKELRYEFDLSQDDLIFVDTTKEGKRFEQAKHYEEGGNIYEKLGLTQQEVENWEKENKVKQRQEQNPNVKESALQLKSGEISQDEYIKSVRKNLPIVPFTEVPQIPTLLEMVGALQSNQLKTGIIGYTKFIDDGEQVATRLDIPAYNNYDVWIVSVHDAKEKNSIGYGQTAYLKDITFITSPKVALNIATERSDKTTFARMKGSWINKDPHKVREMAVKYMNDPEWVQVGMNPYRHSWFYDKSDGMPLLTADELVQVGALVLAKNPVKTTPDNPVFIADKNNPAIKFEKGGYIAPNGQPSNLTPEQYELVRTPEFKAWFGDWEKLANIKIKDSGVDDSTIEILGRDVSKVVDENGEPLALWHFAKRLESENQRFYIFNVDRQLGSHFGSLNQVKNLRYIKGQDYLLPNLDNKDFKFYQVFLNIKNPIRLKDVGIFEADTLTDALNDIKNLKDYDWEYINNYTRKSKDSLLDRVKHIAKGREIDGAIYLNRYESSDDKSVVSKFDDASDLVFKNQIPTSEDSYIAFYPEQIKLADGSNTTFDSSNPDIRYKDGGMFKSHKNIEQIAKEKNVPLLYAKNQLMKGMKVESEHTNSKKVQKIIALQHLDEMINYYSKLKTIEK